MINLRDDVLPNLLFYSPVFSDGKKKDRKSNRLNIKTISFDKKKWKDNLVLHYCVVEKKMTQFELSIFLSIFVQIKKYFR